MDWKEALGAIRESGDLPVDDTPDFVEKPAEKNVRNWALRVVVDRKGRKGKVATIVEGFECDDKEVEDIAKRLKQRLGTGGSCREGEILIQGDRKDDVIKELRASGFRVIS